MLIEYCSVVTLEYDSKWMAGTFCYMDESDKQMYDRNHKIIHSLWVHFMNFKIKLLEVKAVVTLEQCLRGGHQGTFIRDWWC